MPAHKLLTTLTAAGCRLIPDGGRLRVQDPQQVLTDDLRQTIRRHKAELLTLLRGAVVPVEPQSAPPASVDITSEPPDGLVTIHSADGKRWHVVLYRCPTCQGTCWGPTLADSNTWICLDCLPEAPKAEAALLPTPEEVRHE